MCHATKDHSIPQATFAQCYILGPPPNKEPGTQDAMRAGETASVEGCPVKMKLVAPPLYVLTTQVGSDLPAAQPLHVSCAGHLHARLALHPACLCPSPSAGSCIDAGYILSMPAIAPQMHSLLVALPGRRSIVLQR